MSDSINVTVTIADEANISAAVTLPAGYHLAAIQYVGDFDATTAGLRFLGSTDGAAFSPHYAPDAVPGTDDPVTVIVAATGNDFHQGLDPRSFFGLETFKVQAVTDAGVAVDQDGGPRTILFTARKY